MRPISVLAQNLGGIPSVLIQVLFSLPICLLQGGVAKSYEGMQNAVLLCGQNTNLFGVVASFLRGFVHNSPIPASADTHAQPR